MIEEYYKKYCERPSDINEHLPRLREYAAGCDTVVEMGVRGIVSTWAFLAAHPKKLISIDIKHPDYYKSWFPDMVSLDEVKGIAEEEGIDFEFIEDDTREVEIPECDVLFIDTDHTYEQLHKELELHAPKVKKHIILHDTNLDDVWRAALEIKGHFYRVNNNNGLAIFNV